MDADERKAVFLMVMGLLVLALLALALSKAIPAWMANIGQL